MQDNERLIQQLDEARAELHVLLQGIDTGIEFSPAWTIKEVLAHITGWDEVVIASLRAHLAGEGFGPPAVEDIDETNARLGAAREALSYDQLVEEWQELREYLRTLIREMPQEKLEQQILFPWGQRCTTAEVVAIFVHHEREHAGEIRELLG